VRKARLVGHVGTGQERDGAEYGSSDTKEPHRRIWVRPLLAPLLKALHRLHNDTSPVSHLWSDLVVLIAS